jgi:archaellum component FlaF (FlaF/FlaG flagellin family)
MPGTSCGGVNAVFNPATTVIKDVPGTQTKAASYAYYFDNAGTQVSCTLDPEGKTVDVGVSNLYSTVCDSTYVPGATVTGYLGPVVTFGLTVPAASTQKSISVEAAHLIFGLGGQSSAGLRASPWIDPTYYSIRNSGAGSTALTAQLIHVPRTAFWGVDRLSTDAIRDSLSVSGAPEQSIGILSIDYADKARGNLRVLFLQAEGQLSGYLPDSTDTALNKANVRDGHYPLWGYVHFYAANINGAPSAEAGAFVTRFSVPKLDRALVDAMVDASLVPQCAMDVARETEMGAFVRNPYEFRCGCYFDQRTTGRASCPTCTTANDCPASSPACNYGFCEAA